jgi:hypothetical protein
MSRFDLLYDAKRALERAVDLDDLVAALFQDHPDLHSFRIEVTNEYDDNNYSDYSRLMNVNGWRVDCYGEYEDEEDQEESDLPKASPESVNKVMSITDHVKDKHGYGEHEFGRGEYENLDTRAIGSADALCAISVLKGEKIPFSLIREAGERWLLHYADAHGRYSPEDEFELFARENMMGLALDYAKKHGPLSEKTLNYFVLSLNSEDYYYEQLQEYIEWLKVKTA